MVYKDKEKGKKYHKEYMKKYRKGVRFREKEKEYAQRDHVKKRRNVLAKIWRLKNPDKVKEVYKKYYQKNKERHKKYRIEHRKEARLRGREYYQKNKEKIRLKHKEYNQRIEVQAKLKKYQQRPEVKERKKIYLKQYFKELGNKERRKNYNKKYGVKYREKNIIKINKRVKEYYHNNLKMVRKRNRLKKITPSRIKSIKEYQQRPEVKLKNNERDKSRRREDINYSIKKRLRSLLYHAFLKYSKTGKISISKQYGINYEAIIKHLKPFPKDIKNYHIDHIIPLSFSGWDFNNKEHIKKASAPENYQWLTKNQNMWKNNRLVVPCFVESIN